MFTPNVSIHVTDGEATALMVHHLGLAAAYFECTADDHGRKASREIGRRLAHGWDQAALKWLSEMIIYYDGEIEKP